MKPEDFEVAINTMDKRTYRHIENGKIRLQLLKDAKAGKITVEEMQKRARKAKYLFSETQYLKATNQW